MVNWIKFSEESKPDSKGKYLTWGTYGKDDNTRYMVSIEYWDGFRFDNLDENYEIGFFAKINKPSERDEREAFLSLKCSQTRI